MYSQLLRAFAETPGVKLAYDRGVLEIMSPLPQHETKSFFLGRLVVVLTEELRMPLRGGGSTTLRRADLKKGIEPDECFWITNEDKIRGKNRLDLRVDPPPDLGFENDVTNSSLNRMEIYARLKVPEVWRLDQGRLSFWTLGEDGNYQRRETSGLFPMIRPEDLTQFLGRWETEEENSLVADFRAWLRGKLTPPLPAP
jgi:Uma2 family endonuclease